MIFIFLNYYQDYLNNTKMKMKISAYVVAFSILHLSSTVLMEKNTLGGSVNLEMDDKRAHMPPTVCKVTKGRWDNKTTVYEKSCDWQGDLFDCQKFRHPWSKQKKVFNSLTVKMVNDEKSDFTKALEQFKNDDCEEDKHLNKKPQYCPRPHHYYDVYLCMPKKCKDDTECSKELGSSCIFGKCVVNQVYWAFQSACYVENTATKNEEKNRPCWPAEYLECDKNKEDSLNFIMDKEDLTGYFCKPRPRKQVSRNETSLSLNKSSSSTSTQSDNSSQQKPHPPHARPQTPSPGPLPLLPRPLPRPHRFLLPICKGINASNGIVYNNSCDWSAAGVPGLFSCVRLRKAHLPLPPPPKVGSNEANMTSEDEISFGDIYNEYINSSSNEKHHKPLALSACLPKECSNDSNCLGDSLCVFGVCIVDKSHYIYQAACKVVNKTSNMVVKNITCLGDPQISCNKRPGKEFLIEKDAFIPHFCIRKRRDSDADLA